MNRFELEFQGMFRESISYHHGLSLRLDRDDARVAIDRRKKSIRDRTPPVFIGIVARARRGRAFDLGVAADAHESSQIGMTNQTRAVLGSLQEGEAMWSPDRIASIKLDNADSSLWKDLSLRERMKAISIS